MGSTGPGEWTSASDTTNTWDLQSQSTLEACDPRKGGPGKAVQEGAQERGHRKGGAKRIKR
jgi:hypothetical protein